MVMFTKTNNNKKKHTTQKITKNKNTKTASVVEFQGTQQCSLFFIFLKSRLFSSKLLATMLWRYRSPRFQNYFVLSHLWLRMVWKWAALGIRAETRHNTFICTSASVAALFWAFGIQKMYQEFEPCRNKLLSISIRIGALCIQRIAAENLGTWLEYVGLQN